MKRRKTINDKLVNWIKNTVEREFPEDISLVCIYGSWLNGTMNARSDVDCYFVPRTQRGNALARTFVLEGVGYDIFPMSWERLAEIAALESPMQPLVGDVMILYSGSPEEEGKLRQLQATMERNLRDREYTAKIVKARCTLAATWLAELAPDADATQNWKIAGQVIAVLATALAIDQGDYFHFGGKRVYETLRERFPQWVAEGYLGVVEAESSREAVTAAGVFLEQVCRYVGAVPEVSCQAVPKTVPEGEVDAPLLAAIYQEICSTFGKIYTCCEEGNTPLAFASAVVMQQELEDMAEFGCPRYSLLEGYHFRRLEDLAKTAARVEEGLVSFIRQQGGTIVSYRCFEEFEKDNFINP